MNRKLNFITNMLLTAAFAAVFASCGKDEPESRAIEVQDDAALTQNVFADETQGRGGVTFTTTGAWTSTITEKPSSAKATGPQPKPSATGDPVTWIFISPDHGDEAGDYTIAITLTPNMTGADRTAVITISCEGTEIIITVTQKAKTEDGATIQVIDSGTTGECAWTLTGIPPSNYTLAFSGNGAIPNGSYHSYNVPPWYQYVKDIKTIVIQDGVTAIGYNAFSSYTSWNYSNLTSVIIGNSVKTIDNSAFYKCSRLTSVIIGSSVETIGGWAFYDCIGLTSVSIPNSVTTIGDGAFSACSGLTSVNIGNSVRTIGSSAFSGCSSLTDIRVEAANAWYSSENGVLFNKDKTTLVSYPEGKTGSYVIPNSVTTIGGSAFLGCSGLTSVVIGNPVTTIGDYAFLGCSGLTSVVIPNSVTTIGWEAFAGCSGLTSVSIGNSVTTIGDGVFWGCSRLTSVSIPNSVTTIGESAFWNCSGLTSVVIGNSVTTIGKDAFFSCSRLTSVIIGSSVETIGYGAFYYCSGLTSVIIGNSVETIGGYAFFECSGLTSVSIGNSVTTIDDGAFYGCSGLTSVTIGSSVTTINWWISFSKCPGLTAIHVDAANAWYSSENGVLLNKDKTILLYCPMGKTGGYVIPNSVKTIDGGAFSGCSGLTSVSIPNSVTTIDGGAFSGCSGLTSVSIPNSVTTIDGGAFYGCSGLTSVVIPNSVTTIGIYAFVGCSGLTSVTNLRATPQNIYDVFSGVNISACTLKVPASAVDAYKAAYGWKDFGSIVAIE